MVKNERCEMQMNRYEETLAALKEMFPGRLLLGPEEIGRALGGLAKQTIYNKVSNGSFPVKTNKAHGRLKCKIHDLARHIAAM
jgi:hypothetical protein